jgi:chitodextrinase
MNGYGGKVVAPGTADFLTSLSTLIIEAGLRPDQVALGVPSTAQAAGSGYVSNATIEKAVNALVNGTSSGSFTAPHAYPTLRGVMTWSINWDATNNYAWAKAMAAAMDKLPVVEGGNTRPDNGNTGNNDNNNTGNNDNNNTGNNDNNNTGNNDNNNTGNNNNNNTGNNDNNNTNTGDIPTWNASSVYVGGDQVVYNGKVYKASWWTQGDNPETQGPWGPWKVVGNASGNTNTGNNNTGNNNTGNNNTGNNNTGNNNTGSNTGNNNTAIPAWNASSVYVGGDMVSYNGKIYKAAWWTQGDNPETQGQWGPWKLQ